MTRRARVFIGSSSEGLGAAQAIRSLLAHDAQVTLWNEGHFRSGDGYLETLVRSLDLFDFAILVATPDDTGISRGTSALTPRDNVLFEFGLIMGRLGRGRTFLVHPKQHDLRLPSDLLGVTTLSCPWPDGAAGQRVGLQDFISALGAACDRIRDTISGWTALAADAELRTSGLLRCYTNLTEAQAAIGRAIMTARRSILLTATNLAFTPALNVAELQQRIREGVDVRFLVLNPRSAHVEATAREFMISAVQLREENRLHLRSLIDLRDFSLACGPGAARPGTVAIRLYDAPPRMRSYSFDQPDGTSFFVPYLNRSPSRPLPVFEARNDGAVAQRYLSAIENLWSAPDTVTAEAFLAQDPSYL
ncbi:TIR domain-containing protein [Micromonospora citrea]|uniref:TIR domain-containing protein n=1 Tax=Micromonospora citrea TaxID=47855 RepID=UPI003C42DF56